MSLGKKKKNLILSFKKGKTDNKEKFVFAKETDTVEDKPSEKLSNTRGKNSWIM